MDRNEESKRKPETHFKGENWEKHKNTSRITIGILVIAVGFLFLLRQMGIYIPHWLLSWKMLLITLGFVNLIRHNFKNIGGYILIFIGLVFILKDSGFGWIDSNLFWPIAIIGVGILILAKSTLLVSLKRSNDKDGDSFNGINSEDFIRVDTFFGGVTKNIVSKDFKGGSLSQIFGGSKLNFMRTDFEGEAVIDITCVFGGSTLILPADWKVKSDVTTIFGGMDDKRPSMPTDMTAEPKTLVLKGICIFGGIDIKSYD